VHDREEIQEKLGGNVIQGNGEIFIHHNVLSAGFPCLFKHWTDLEKRPKKVTIRIFKEQTEEPANFGTVKTTKKCVKMAKILKTGVLQTNQLHCQKYRCVLCDHELPSVWKH